MTYMRDQGFRVDKTERWIPHVKRRKDLFGIIDIVAIKPIQGTIGIQVTSQDHVNDRIAKIQAEPNTLWLLACGWKIHVHGWRKTGGRWIVTVTDVGGLPQWKK